MNREQLRDFARRMDDEDDDPNILADGERMRVPMYRLTDAQRQVATFAAQHGGNTLHRPGFVRPRDAAATARLNDAYAAYERDLTSAWQDADPGWPTGAGEHAMLGAQVGQPCTVRNAEYPNAFGSPGTLQMIEGRLVCVPKSPPAPAAGETSADARDAKAAAYAEYEKNLVNAWRGGQQ